ncbi:MULTISPECIES: DUF6191 domain-containing protein [unclassified Streptomyces]|uniref:DUF6191 domain-containing protein n=1 Tax=unclassified Streptomyces TaxID=2593676 RepID=UPI000F7993A8|nr:DUF6191 domain-containing protein [Streptomyces sp. WAC01280]RSS55709.1 hypothetical protein EF909_21510 [Streptomyces sp. WAC01280]
MTVFDPIAELFAPGRRHTEEELRRQALTREDPGDADPSRGPIDLTSGRVTIRIPRPGTVAVPGPGSEGRVEEVEPVGEGGGLAAAGDAELGEDVGDVDARRLR